MDFGLTPTRMGSITYNVPQLCAALCCACGKVEYRCCYALMRIINEKLK